MPTWGELVRIAGDGVPVTVPRDAARDAAREELQKAEYHRHDPTPVQRAINWLWERFTSLLDRLGGPGHSGTTGLVVFLVLFAAIAGLLWWRLGRPRRTAARDAALFTGQGGPRTAAEHRAAAERHAAAGEWADAVREQLRALVRDLEERTLLDPRPGRTADEAAIEAGRRLPEHARELRTAARVFDDIAYGGRTADQAAYQQLADLDRRLRQTRPTLTPAGTA
ncbi:hypothetical protein C7C46_31270 [Streptomyces tateyamensis]|uniref:Protein-glutamine gamma-glutamyltransferase-like C-terminal domain-containing protein n=1 Tax=Streptomyces tateyamensis TaxID=565073 RepID=A0A2V4N7I4_9ACTN|nr:DUF4129 domain-containing protein [Streptomyces tateyamensis]PYC66468.1 hypothetical protein C7C46_31270 [Streptomyces tateyamensis]